MLNPFDISPLSDSIQLDDEGRAQTTFTVSNRTKRVVTARAVVKMDTTASGDHRPANPAWFKVDTPERTLASDGTQQFVVHLAVPRDTPVGKYSFHLQVIAIDERPEEEFTDGPAIGFEIKPIEPVTTTGGKIPWWVFVIIAVVVLLIGGGIGWWLLSGPSTVTVPDVRHKPLEQARELLADEGLEVGATPPQESAEPPDTVIDQQPKAGETVEQGTAVALTVSVPRRFVKVPDVIGKSKGDATAAMTSAGLRVDAVVEAGEGQIDTVTDTNPRPGTDVLPGDGVRLVTPAPVIMPLLTGRTLGQARTELPAIGLAVGNVREIPGPATGLIVSQNPAPGVRVGKGHRIDLVVMRGLF